MMKKNISYIPMDHALEIWLLEKLLRERQRILYECPQIPCPSYNLPCPYKNSRR